MKTLLWIGVLLLRPLANLHDLLNACREGRLKAERCRGKHKAGTIFRIAAIGCPACAAKGHGGEPNLRVGAVVQVTRYDDETDEYVVKKPGTVCEGMAFLHAAGLVTEVVK